MDAQFAPTKGNLIATKKSLELAKMGFELLDRKRNILIREMMTLIDYASSIQSKIDSTYSRAYLALQKANITLGICEELAGTVPIEQSLKLSYRSIMGVEIPITSIDEKFLEQTPPFGLYFSNSVLDEAHLRFIEVKQLSTELAKIENSVYRLANAIKKTQKRANALKNIIIPLFEKNIKLITNSLEEKDREEFSRLKIIKKKKKP